ncbi:MAG: biotin/lipoyl-containing protein [Desulfitobacteriaceae bacterium]
MSISITSPMSGNITEVLVEVGEKVEESQAVMILEAMKMENEVVAEQSGTVEKILVKAGQAVKAGEVLVQLA